MGILRFGKSGKGGGFATSDLLQIALAMVFVSIFGLLLPLTLEVRYSKDKENDLLVCALGITSKWYLYKLVIPAVYTNFDLMGKNLLTFETQMPNSEEAQNEYQVEVNRPFRLLKDVWPKLTILTTFIRKIINKINNIYKKFFKSITCKELFWYTEIGVDDAASTALLTGILWNAKNFTFTNLKRNVKVGFFKPDFKVQPFFSGKRLYTNFKCIFVIRLGHIIFAGLKLMLVVFVALAKRGEGAVERSSN